MTVALLALAGGLGALARTEVSRSAARRAADRPWGTRMVNLLGTVALATLLASEVDGDTRRILGMGFLGGFTTFSTWMLESDLQGRPGRLREVLVQLLPALAAIAIVRAVA